MAKRYPQAKIDEALLAYYTLGTYEKASEATGTPWTTIQHWINVTHTDRYDELAAKHGPALERQVVAKLARTAERATNVTDRALDATCEAITDSAAPKPDREQYEEGDQGDDAYRADVLVWATRRHDSAKNANALSSAAKNAALVLGIATDKKLTLEGRPTVITQHRDIEDYLRSLNELIPGLVIDSTATEIPNGQARLNGAAPTPISAAHRSQSVGNAREKQAA